MPTSSRPAMNQAEQQEFSQACLEFTLAKADGKLESLVLPNQDGIPQISATIKVGGYTGAIIREAVDSVNRSLATGQANITDGPNGPKIQMATITIKSELPTAHMDTDEENAFNQALATINQATRTHQCNFDSVLDDQANIFFRYSVQDNAADPTSILDAIHNVVNAVFAGKAVRVELPDGAVMLMPRWNINQPQ